MSSLLGHILGEATAIVWRWGNDRRAVAAFVGRYSAHLAILVLALLLGLVGRIALAPISVAITPEANPVSRPVAAEPVVTPTVFVAGGVPQWPILNQTARAVFRKAQPRTDVPERVRLEVITYTVQSGDNIFLIAERFGLSPYTVAWSNMETLQGSPWLIQPGLTLFIPPVDGAYHTVMEGETPESIAEQYEVVATALYNIWNDLAEGAPLREGMQLMIPGAVGEDVEWEAPPPEPTAPGVGAAAVSWGACGDVSVSGPGASGWFILPTGSYAVSGWYFGDPRNPGHIGLDYKCRMGDPIYAADNGVVVFAGWGGGYGNLVRVRHGNGYETYYAHFSGFAVGCGQPVYQGQLLGYCGSTGWSTGAHLHYEIRFNGVPQNPQLFEP
ncbi:MAG TPA: LysM peptidoglycan-binding domain-containing M23 family metallopeptidase [Anaerolineae bacterium]|nr:LysM peptidoglycan-binding domain-containing M23 family metallopeptidase [Anaerolineae bacterium]HQI85397.1 LysM peptidoglycan-binding domain-containing M23 family metallopeptidase [Anaerolineae bacterium]